MAPGPLLRRVVLKGQPDEELVMCTCNKTYALKHVETSNALLLVPPRKVSGHAAGPATDAVGTTPLERHKPAHDK